MCKVRNYEENFAILQSDSFSSLLIARGTHSNRVFEDSEVIFIPISKNWRDKVKYGHGITSPKGPSSTRESFEEHFKESPYQDFMETIKNLTELENGEIGKYDSNHVSSGSKLSLGRSNSQIQEKEKIEVKIVSLKSNPFKHKDILVKICRDKHSNIVAKALDIKAKLYFFVESISFINGQGKDLYKYEGRLGVCHFMRWNKDSIYPSAALVNVLLDDTDREKTVVEKRYGLTLSDYSDDTLAQIEQDPCSSIIYEPFDLENELKMRRDYRERTVITLESEYFEGKETTFSVQQSEEGEDMELTVYVVDIDYYIPHSSALDLEAKSRKLNYNFPMKEYSMLPESVVKVLSFKPDHPALAIAFTIPLNQGVSHLSFRNMPAVEKCVITPTARLNYYDADPIIKSTIQTPSEDHEQSQGGISQDDFSSSNYLPQKRQGK